MRIVESAIKTVEDELTKLEEKKQKNDWIDKQAINEQNNSMNFQSFIYENVDTTIRTENSCLKKEVPIREVFQKKMIQI